MVQDPLRMAHVTKRLTDGERHRDCVAMSEQYTENQSSKYPRAPLITASGPHRASCAASPPPAENKPTIGNKTCPPHPLLSHASFPLCCAP